MVETPRRRGWGRFRPAEGEAALKGVRSNFRFAVEVLAYGPEVLIPEGTHVVISLIELGKGVPGQEPSFEYL